MLIQEYYYFELPYLILFFIIFFLDKVEFLLIWSEPIWNRIALIVWKWVGGWMDESNCLVLII